MNKALAFPALTAAEQKKFRSELLWELRRMILKYNGGSGSSVRSETAEQIFESMMYCVSACLRMEPDPAQAVRKVPGWEVYRRGLEIVKNTVEKSEALYREVLATRVQTDLLAYNETLDTGIPSFFQLYNPDFAAHETPTLIDYPLSGPPDDLSGAFYIRAYLEELKKENLLCAKYRKNQIRAALFLYGKKYRQDYRELLVNIPEIMAEAERHAAKKS